MNQYDIEQMVSNQYGLNARFCAKIMTNPPPDATPEEIKQYKENGWLGLARLNGRLNYQSAAFDELGEFARSDEFWKFWSKKPQCDTNNAKLELVDLFHFLMSWSMVAGAAAPHDLESTVVRICAREIVEGYNLAKNDGLTSTPKDLTSRELKYEMRAHMFQLTSLLVAPERFKTPAYLGHLMMWYRFWATAYLSGCTFDHIQAIYTGKSVLNDFRISNDDAGGKYHRKWNLDGKREAEDNDYLMTWVLSEMGRGRAVSRENVKVFLNEAYQKHLKNIELQGS